MNTNKMQDMPVPPIIKEYVINALNPSAPHHIRSNYRDILATIRQLCTEAITQFDKENNITHIPARRGVNKK